MVFPIKYNKQRRILFVLISIFFICSHFSVKAQVSVYTSQNLSFGAFSHGSSGGSVIIAPSGTRSVTGDVIAVNLGFQYLPAIFEVEVPLNSIVNISNGPNVELTGSNGGSMTLSIGNSDPVSPFVSTASAPAKNSIKIGATLTVGGPSANPPGTYSGSFSVTFIQE